MFFEGLNIYGDISTTFSKYNYWLILNILPKKKSAEVWKTLDWKQVGQFFVCTVLL